MFVKAANQMETAQSVHEESRLSPLSLWRLALALVKLSKNLVLYSHKYTTLKLENINRGSQVGTHLESLCVSQIFVCPGPKLSSSPTIVDQWGVSIFNTIQAIAGNMSHNMSQ